MNLLFVAAVAAAALLPNPAPGQSACNGTPLSGTVRDTTAALIPGATIALDGATEGSSGQDGRFRFACVTAGPHTLTVTAAGFARTEMSVKTPHAGDFELRLAPSVESSVTVDTDVSTDAGTTSSGAMGQTIAGDKLQTLADDPDDLLRELQQMAGAAGGNPANATISVDGFQNDATLPPKSSIAYVKVNPDLFSAEYREPPFEGGRIEVYTKPGASALHGALFTTNSSQWMNARDPFSISRAAIGKQRYGFELTGPIRRKGSNFSVNLEHRSIDNFSVVNAVTLDANGNAQSTIANVATPQRLWVGQARVDWQLGPKNIFFVSYSANVNALKNVGVGGTTLAESGYDSGTYDHVLRFSNVTTASARLVHEARLSVERIGETDAPVSTAPQVQVAGSFTGGGATIGQQVRHELFTEWDDDVIVSTKKHLIKAGWQFIDLAMRFRLPTNFNGTYVFGGGPAPVLGTGGAPTAQTATITGLEQYRRALLRLPGGTPTAFTSVVGQPEISFNQVRLGAFVQDDWTVRPDLHLSFGMRYFLQNDPLMLNGATPRLGVTWVPDKKKTWELSAHAGLFAGYDGWARWSELRRLDGVERISSTVYNPVYGQPSSATTAPIYTQRTLAPDFRNSLSGIAQIGATRHLPGGWDLSAMLIGIRLWSEARTLNVNTPTNGDPQGPRPFAPNVNILQTQNSGRGLGDIEFASLSNNALKRLQFYYGAVRINLRDNTDDNLFFSPQSAYTDAGEYSRRMGNSLWQTFGNATLKLPGKVQMSANFFGNADQPYNITTGFDNNGDGNFNDRPQFARAGQSGAIQTNYGLLVASGGTGVLRRNLGNMPWNAHLDANVQRSWVITHNKKAEHQQSVTANVRSSNLINHTNVTSVGGVLGSPLFGVPYAADNGRRVEGGLRYSF